MTTATVQEWLDIPDFSVQAGNQELEAFFGIPPAPRDALDVNIRDKRKHWKKKEQKSRTEDGLRRAGGVLQAIADAEDQLKRGAAAAGGGTRATDTADVGRAPQTAEDVAQELERILFRGRYVDALERIQRYDLQWADYPAYIDMRAFVILEAVQNVPGLQLVPGVLESAMAGTRQAIERMGPTEARYLTLVELLEAAGRPEEVPGIFAEANARLGQISASFRASALKIRFRKERWLDLLRYCVELVQEAMDDRALRSELVQMILERAVADLLPLRSAEAVSRYQKVIATAAWIADGIPEAEDAVRFHRMWASNADQPVFGGNWQWRAFFALITLFAALPLINSSNARPAWQVLLNGPALGDQKKRKMAASAQNRAWLLVTRNPYVHPLHEKIQLPWQNRPGYWPDNDEFVKLFNF